MPLLHGPDEHHEAPKRSPKPKRSSLAHISLLKRLAFAGVLLGGIGEMSQPKPHPMQPPPAVRTVEDFLYIVQSATGHAAIREDFAPMIEPEVPPDPGIAPGAMAKTALSKTWGWGKRLCSTPSETKDETCDTVGNTVSYLHNYRLNEEQAEEHKPEELDCNDHANVTCERLDRLGVPMYLLSIWPEDPETRFDIDWHEMAVCKLQDKCFLIFDDRRTTLWHGSLASFVLQYGSRTRMRIIPRVGISEFAEPKYDNFASKFLVQAAHGVGDEEGMRSMDLRFRGESILIAANTRPEE